MSAATRGQHRLRKHADYQAVYKSGRKQFAKNMAYFYARRPATSAAVGALATPPAGPRVGLTVPKAVGGAVTRNRIKRRLREVVREHLALLGGASVDVVLHPRKVVAGMDFVALEREVAVVFRSVGAALDRDERRSRPAPAVAGEAGQ